MSFNRKDWRNFFFQNDHIPPVLCPNCSKGYLHIDGDIISHETSNTQLWKNHEEFSYQDYAQKFVIILKCNNHDCSEVVIGTGTGSIEVDGVSDMGDYGEFQNTSIHYIPEYFTPPLSIIAIKDIYPMEIKSALKDSFKSFFHDNESCAIKIRITVENILDIARIPKSIISDRKRKRLNLHQRIEKFNSIKSPEIGELLISIKWIGNYGSHNDKLSREDILDAYSILERVLTLLYDESVIELSKKINNKKKPISKIKRHGNPF